MIFAYRLFLLTYCYVCLSLSPSLCVLGFVVASLVVFGTGLPLAQWHRLARTDWSLSCGKLVVDMGLKMQCPSNPLVNHHITL